MGVPRASSSETMRPSSPAAVEVATAKRTSNETAKTAETAEILVTPVRVTTAAAKKQSNGANDKTRPGPMAVLGVTEGPPEEEMPKGLKLGVIIASIVVVMFLVLLDMSIIVTVGPSNLARPRCVAAATWILTVQTWALTDDIKAIPKITSDFHSLPDVGWYGAAYQLASASVQPLTGKLYTYLRTKWTFLVFFGLFELGSLICGAANSSAMLIIGRAIAGIGSSGLTNGALMIISAAIPLAKRPGMLLELRHPPGKTLACCRC